uniref:Uncharacterized protein LOC102801451 n=1 Tax=Saccoglossus kowalevskii TaxID=10224 RepID=A0ABM0MP64_SACKO
VSYRSPVSVSLLAWWQRRDTKSTLNIVPKKSGRRKSKKITEVFGSQSVNGDDSRGRQSVSSLSSGDDGITLVDIIAEIRDLKKDMRQQIKVVDDGIQQLSSEVRELKSGVKVNCERIQLLTDEVKYLRDKLYTVEFENDKTKAELLRNNLIFHGLPQSGFENWQETEDALRSFISEKLDMHAEEIEFERVHRITHVRSRPQPVVARFLRYKQREKVLRASSVLKGTKYWIREDYTPRIRNLRGKLGKYVMEAREEGKSAKLLYDKIKIDNTVYKYDEETETIKPLETSDSLRKQQGTHKRVSVVAMPTPTASNNSNTVND